MTDKLHNEQELPAEPEPRSLDSPAGEDNGDDCPATNPEDATAAYQHEGSNDVSLDQADYIQRDSLNDVNQGDVKYILEGDDDVDLARYDSDEDEVDLSRYETVDDDIDYIAHKRVLLVEDERDIAELITKHLKAMRVRDVITVNNADAAYFTITKDRDLFPDIVLLELALPGTDGIQLLARLRAHKNPKINTMPAVVITMLESPSIYRRAARQKVGAFLKKPISMDGLRAGMEDAFKGVVVEQPFKHPKSWLDDLEEEELQAKQQKVIDRAAAKARKQGFLVRLLSWLIPWSGRA